MFARIPAAPGDIHAAVECQLVVNYDDFLMLAAAHGNGIVQANLNVVGALFFPHFLGPDFPIAEERQGRIPAQQINPQVRILAGFPGQQFADINWRFHCIGLVAPQQINATIDIPTGDENTLAGGNNGVIERPVVIGAIDQGAHIGGQTMAPAIGIF